jgi:hypothetical protein
VVGLVDLPLALQQRSKEGLYKRRREREREREREVRTRGTHAAAVRSIHGWRGGWWLVVVAGGCRGDWDVRRQ